MTILIRNPKATYEYTIIDIYTAGIILNGTEVKSIRQGNASIAEAYCQFEKNELFIRHMHIKEYMLIKHTNHEPYQDRKLLLNRQELNKLSKAVNEKGLTIIPLSISLSDSGFVKIQIATAKGKKSYDKKAKLKSDDINKQLRKEIVY